MWLGESEVNKHISLTFASLSQTTWSVARGSGHCGMCRHESLVQSIITRDQEHAIPHSVFKCHPQLMNIILVRCLSKENHTTQCKMSNAHPWELHCNND